MKRIPLKILLDTSEMLYYNEGKKVYRFGSECVMDVKIEKMESFWLPRWHSQQFTSTIQGQSSSAPFGGWEDSIIAKSNQEAPALMARRRSLPVDPLLAEGSTAVNVKMAKKPLLYSTQQYDELEAEDDGEEECIRLCIL